MSQQNYYHQSVVRRVEELKERYPLPCDVPLNDIEFLEDLERRSCRFILDQINNQSRNNDNEQATKKYIVIFNQDVLYFKTESEAIEYGSKRQSEEYQKGWESVNPFACGSLFMKMFVPYITKQ